MPFSQCVDENQYFHESRKQSSHQYVAFRQWPPAKYYHHAGEPKIDKTSPICKNDEKFEEASSSMPSDENRLDNVSTVVNKVVDESPTEMTPTKSVSKLAFVENFHYNSDVNEMK